MDKTPFLAGVQQELFFLPAAARMLASSGASADAAAGVLEIAIKKAALSDAHLEGLAILDAGEGNADGLPPRPTRAAAVRAMVEDVIDQMRHLELFDKDGRITPQGLEQIENRDWLRRAVRQNYRVRGRDDTRRSVVGQLNRIFLDLEDMDPEREADPGSVRFRRALCLAEFMMLHFWMQELEGPPERGAFTDLVMDVRDAALDGLDAGEGGIEYAALVMADAAAGWLLKNRSDARGKLPAARSTVLMLCDAGVLAPSGFPGGVQWLRPVEDLKQRRRRREGRR